MKRILHIDDDEEVRILLNNILKKKYDYIGVPSAEEGMDIVKEDKICLILLDLKLSGRMQGRDFLDELKKMKKDISVIALTASTDKIEEDLKKDYPELVVKCVMKPFETDKLLKDIEGIIG